MSSCARYSSCRSAVGLGRAWLLVALLLAAAPPATAQETSPASIDTAEGRSALASDTAGRSAGVFDSDAVLELTLTGDLRTLTRDRDSTSAQYHPVTLAYAGADGSPITVEGRAKTRGVWRRAQRNCSFPPLRLRVARDAGRGTLFHRDRNIKLVTHCQRMSEYEQYVLQEYLLYRVYNLVTPYSFNVRLARITYEDSRTSSSTVRYGILLEDDDALARRHDAVVLEAKGGLYNDFDRESTMLASAFQYMIGNTDFSVAGLHNIKILGLPSGSPVLVPYDFDFAGIIATRYATPDPKLGIRSVRERLYRGVCRTEAEWAPIVGRFNAQRGAINDLYASLPDLDQRNARRARDYYDGFFRTINDPRALRRDLIDRCLIGA